jgi:hypothetical protein
VVVLDPVVRILFGVVNPFGNQGHQRRTSRRRRCYVFRHVDVDDLAVPVHRSVDVAPNAADLHDGFIYEPRVTHCMMARSRRVDQ